MTRTMYDSVTANDIPHAATMVGGYVNGTYAWSASDWARFSLATQVRIATRANVNDGNCLDVEKGDATPDEAPQWVVMRRKTGIEPSVYCNELNGWADVRRAFRQQNVPEPPYWVAHYDNIPTIPDGAVAKQYANPTLHRQGHFDLSVVADYWPGIDKKVPMANSELILEHAASRIYQALQMHHRVDPADHGGVGQDGHVAPDNEPLRLVMALDDAAWRLYSLLQLKTVTAGGTAEVSGKEKLPFVESFLALCDNVRALQDAVAGLRSDFDRFLSAGVQLEGEGVITVKPRPGA